MAGQSDFIVVANRLPVDRTEDGWAAAPGGLVTALKPVLQRNDGAWVGWPGCTTPVAVEDMPSAEETGGITMVPVNLDETDYQDFYEGFSNAALWPLYHDVIVHPRYRRAWWSRYREVNQRFAEAVIAEAAEGATIWVQDYQLHLVPSLIRQRRPDVRIGFFLHIPFPTPELFRQLPWREEILAGTLGADVIGFHTQDNARNFLQTLRCLDYDVQISDDSNAKFLRGARIHEPAPDEGSSEDTGSAKDAGSSEDAGWGAHISPHIIGRARTPEEGGGTHVSHIGVFPISIDSAAVAEVARSPEVVAKVAQLRNQLGSPKLLVTGVDRMDYTKGIHKRLLAIEELLDGGVLEQYGLTAQDVSMVQVATPSRERLSDYKATREDVERIVSRINGKHGSLGRSVVQYVHSNLPFEDLAALYSAADIMLVTALKDGMNLVAKEYVACHSDGSGALVLSEFTGAATQLSSAYLCNPYDKAAIAATIEQAAADSPRNRRERMLRLWENVRDHDVDEWAQNFLHALAEA